MRRDSSILYTILRTLLLPLQRSPPRQVPVLVRRQLACPLPQLLEETPQLLRLLVSHHGLTAAGTAAAEAGEGAEARRELEVSQLLGWRKR